MRIGILHLNGWAGHTTQEVEIVYQTPHRWRIRAIVTTRLAGRARYLQPGEYANVPKSAITEK